MIFKKNEDADINVVLSIKVINKLIVHQLLILNFYNFL